MVMELIVGAAVAIIVSLLVNGDDDGGLIAIGSIAGFVGIFALRFRLQRRAWSEETQFGAMAALDSGRNSRGLLKFDRPAMVMELMVGAAAAVIIGLLINGDDDGSFVAPGVIAAFTGVFALRFRLQRRARLSELQSAAADDIRSDGLGVANADIPKKNNRGLLSFDKPAMMMELMVGAAAAVILGLLINADDDGSFIALGVIAAFVGVFALRFRLQRRTWLQEWISMPRRSDRSDEAFPPSGRSHVVVRVDKVSIFLELVFLAAATLIGGLIFNGDDDLFPLGAVAAVVGLFALRFRFRRHRYVWPRQPASRLRLSFDKTSIFLELLIGACAVVIAAVLFEGDNDLFGLAAAAAVLGVVAIRFRLSRRIGPVHSGTETAGQRSEDYMARQH